MQVAARPPLRRLVALDRMIREARFPNARSAASELEVHERTIHRDLEFLRDSLGAPLAFDHKRNGYYYSARDFALPFVRVTEGELVALFLAERLLQEYRDTPYAADLASTFRKLTSGLDGELSVDMAHLDSAISFRRQPVAPGDADRFRLLTRAVRQGRQMELVYWTASRDQGSRRVVDPYHLASVDGCWYLVAYCHTREEVLMFVPSRIRSMRETGARFERPADFRIADYLDVGFRVLRGDGQLRTVRLRFGPEAARYVREKTWHPSQKLKERKNGGLEMTLQVSDLLEVRRWVLSWGAQCEVQQPEELRTAVVDELRKTLSAYFAPAGAAEEARR